MYICKKKFYPLAIIRKYRTPFVLFLTLVFLVYARHNAGLNVFSDNHKTDNSLFKSEIAFILGNYTSSHTERLTVHSILLKNISFDGISFCRLSGVGLYSILSPSRHSAFSISGPSILKFICILRI